MASVDALLGRLVEPPLADLAAQLRQLPTLSAAEQQVVSAAAARSVREAVWQRVNRVAVLELNAARVTGALTAGDSEARWQEWVAGLTEPGGWEALAEPYPTLLPRVRRVAGNRCRAAYALARRYGQDRAALATLLGAEPGELRQVSFGAGDSHQGGQSVAVLSCDTGRLVYKPRSVAVDAALGRLLPQLLPGEPDQTRIRVPAVVVRGDPAGEYGWAEYIRHRYCTSDPELRCFYRGLGHWLAVMRMVAGSDLHFENLIAAGPVPVVVDCETLFTPHRAVAASGFGAALDLAADRINQSVLRTGLLPARGAALQYRGGDPSGAGRLPGEQPELLVPTVAGLGTDQARAVMTSAPPLPGTNHPSAEPRLDQYWQVVVEAFTALSEQLRDLDRAGGLAPLLTEFADCPVRVVVRDTAGYTELERMLWHPRSLHRPEPAIARAAELLARQAEHRPGAPDDPAVIEAEVAELLDGDVPVFVTTPRSGVLTGPRGTRWGPPEDLIRTALTRWREADLAVDEQVVRSSLVGAYLNDGWTPPATTRTTRIRAGDQDRRRRAQAAAIMRQVCQTAIRGGDRTVAWVAPVLDVTGWAVRPFGPDLYGGTGGVAVLLAGYQQEVAAGRADPVPELGSLLGAAVHTLRLVDDQQERDRAEAAKARIRLRPEPAGGYLGLGSRIWTWLLLADLAAVSADEAISRAAALAKLVPSGVAESQDPPDLLGGAAGAVVPLLGLSGRTGDPHWRSLAVETGQRLRQQAVRSESGACWPTPAYPAGIGGLSHGVTGYGWVLARLAIATADPDFAALADAAFGWEEQLYDPERGGWRDARRTTDKPALASAWCHGSVGIGIAAADLLVRGWAGRGDQLRDRLDRAARAAWERGFGATHTLCHGDLSAWELVDRARSAGLGPPSVDSAQSAARVLTSLEDHGAVTNVAREVFSPALLPGLGGVAYQLLRMHPECPLPSVLLPDPTGLAHPG